MVTVPFTVVALTVVAFVDPFKLSIWFVLMPCFALMYAFVDSISDRWLSRSTSPFKVLLILTRLLYCTFFWKENCLVRGLASSEFEPGCP